MITNIQRTKQLIVQSVEDLGQELQTLIDQRSSPGRIRSGAWVEEPNTILGFVSFTPHSDPEEESIEISVKLEIGTIANILMDICWSDGEIIDVIAKEAFGYDSQDDLELKLINWWRNLLPTINSKMEEQIIPDRPPRYRSN